MSFVTLRVVIQSDIVPRHFKIYNAGMPASSQRNSMKLGTWLFCSFVALIAISISGILLWTSMTSSTMAGCGTASTCSQVLASPWSHVLGVPVSLFAVCVYTLMLMMLWHVRSGTRANASTQRSAAWLLAMCSVAVIAAVIWFMGLQVFVIGAACAYCIASHIAGVLAAGPLLWNFRSARQAGSFGVAAVVALIAVQLALPSSGGFQATRIGQGVLANFDEGTGSDRRVGLLDGLIVFKPAGLPHLGELDAPIVMAEVMDYTCPHCKQLHAQLETLRKRSDDAYLIVILPTPLSSTCNSNLKSTGKGHGAACAMATYMLGLWHQQPDLFEQTHDAVMRSDAYTLDEMKDVLQQALGEAPPQLTQESKEAAKKLIANNVKLQQRLGPGMPQLAVGSVLIRGRPYRIEDLAELIAESQANNRE